MVLKNLLGAAAIAGGTAGIPTVPVSDLGVALARLLRVGFGHVSSTQTWKGAP